MFIIVFSFNSYEGLGAHRQWFLLLIGTAKLRIENSPTEKSMREGTIGQKVEQKWEITPYIGQSKRRFWARIGRVVGSRVDACLVSLIQGTYIYGVALGADNHYRIAVHKVLRQPLVFPFDNIAQPRGKATMHTILVVGHRRITQSRMQALLLQQGKYFL